VAGDEFYITMQCGMEAEAAKVGVSVKSQGPQKFDPTLQKPILDSVVAARPDAIMIATTDVKAMQTPLNAAAQTGSKIVLVDTTVQDPAIAVSAMHRTTRVVERQRSRRLSSSTRTAAR
jgi:ribose transport system substrate-binding protein